MCDITDIVKREAVVGWQGEYPRGDVFRDWAGAVCVSVWREVGQERVEVTAGEDIAFLLQLGIDPFAGGEGFKENWNIRLIGGMVKEFDGGARIRRYAEYALVSVVNLLTIIEKRINLAETTQAHQRLQFVHLRIRADIGTVELAVNREVAEFKEFLLKRGILEYQQPALA